MNVKLYLGDANEILDKISNKSIQTVCIDPPYNINKADWDNIPNYVQWLTNIIKKLSTKMKDNGSMFIFHNDMEQIAELMISIKNNTNLIFRK
jgi:DNA modification methylase